MIPKQTQTTIFFLSKQRLGAMLKDFKQRQVRAGLGMSVKELIVASKAFSYSAHNYILFMWCKIRDTTEFYQKRKYTGIVLLSFTEAALRIESKYTSCSFNSCFSRH